MNWQSVEVKDMGGMVVHFTNDQPNTDFTVSSHAENYFNMSIHLKDKGTSELLKVVFRTLEDAKAHAEDLSKTENACTTNRIVDALASYLASARLLGERQEGAGLG